MTFYRSLTAALLFLCLTTHGQSLPDSIRSIAPMAQGTVGVAYKMAGAPSYEGLNTNAHLPMQSVYKFHLALYFLDQVDKKHLTLDQPIPISKDDWEPKEFSPLRDQYKTPPASLRLRDLLAAIIINSDNVACDILFRKAGGPAQVDSYIKGLGIPDISIAATEAQMHHSWPVQYTNWTTPAAMLALLEKFDAGLLLTPASTQQLLQWMTASTRISRRLKGLLPTGTPVAHKPGTSDVSPEGIAAATNDVGIITLPNKKHLLIAVFVTDAKATETTREWVIARIAQLVFQANTTSAETP
ncbi:class A beta-lactamase [Puia dinghuensis]|uniref:beta-lactamase n=1 Tax=Puia dinghuensis TaxID=1792502 RepID=A0A8J2UBW4_9BACT|nr:class A beta-lactamase [Puia dinghuensis]GGA94024.1 CepA family class A extended-spectrum beta-lactamase [Puia dinghuensis]